jgi:hypothetical protein
MAYGSPRAARPAAGKLATKKTPADIRRSFEWIAVRVGAAGQFCNPAGVVLVGNGHTPLVNLSDTQPLS